LPRYIIGKRESSSLVLPIRTSSTASGSIKKGHVPLSMDIFSLLSGKKEVLKKTQRQNLALAVTQKQETKCRWSCGIKQPRKESWMRRDSILNTCSRKHSNLSCIGLMDFSLFGTFKVEK
jgi:hypothetical protein